MMEQRRALTIPFNTDKDNLVCVTHGFITYMWTCELLVLCLLTLLWCLLYGCHHTLCCSHVDHTLIVIWDCLMEPLCDSLRLWSLYCTILLISKPTSLLLKEVDHSKCRTPDSLSMSSCSQQIFAYSELLPSQVNSVYIDTILTHTEALRSVQNVTPSVLGKERASTTFTVISCN